jgi:glutaredoxin
MLEVTLLTQEACGFCADAKDLLARLAGEYPIEVTEVDMRSQDCERLALAAGIMFPPGILVGGQAFGYGRPSERRLRRELGRRLR